MTFEVGPLRWWVGVPGCVTALAFCSATPAHAQAEDQAAARTLFDEARTLMKSGENNAACPKLEAAMRLYSSVGIALNLADCYEKVGRTASAWTEFGEAFSVAERSNRPDDAAEAKRRQTALEPKLTRLVVHAPAGMGELVVHRDGLELPPAAWDAPLPVDPGSHDIRAEAPGRVAWAQSVMATGAGQTTTVEVPTLSVAPVAPVLAVGTLPTTQSGEEHPSTSSGYRAAGWTLIGAGAAVGVGGGVLMAIEAGRASTARNDGNQSSYSSTKTPWTIGLIGAIAGGAAAVVGVVLLVTSRHRDRGVWFDLVVD
jgi:hypothetical protein